MSQESEDASQRRRQAEDSSRGDGGDGGGGGEQAAAESGGPRRPDLDDQRGVQGGDSEMSRTAATRNQAPSTVRHPATAPQDVDGERGGDADDRRDDEDGGDAGDRQRRTIGPPVDPYADPRSGAGPYEQPPPSEPEANEDGVVAGEVHEPQRPPRTELERLKQYRKEQDAEAPPKPPPHVIGRYPFESHLPTHPADTIRQFSSLGGGKPRRRRSDWPILTFALVVAAAVMIGCCLAGFALFSAWHPFNQ